MDLSSGKLQFWEWKSPLLVPEHFVPRPCRKTFPENIPAWMNVKYQPGRGTKCSPPLTVQSGAIRSGVAESYVRACYSVPSAEAQVT
jgi:hypothetical protein